MRPLAGRPLLDYTAERRARRASSTASCCRPTPSEIADAGRARRTRGAVPAAGGAGPDDTPMLPVMRHAVDALSRRGWVPDIIVLLQPTSPLRRPEHIREAVTLLRERGADSVVSVVELPRHLSPDYVMRIEEGGCGRSCRRARG